MFLFQPRDLVPKSPRLHIKQTWPAPRLLVSAWLFSHYPQNATVCILQGQKLKDTWPSISTRQTRWSSRPTRDSSRCDLQVLIFKSWSSRSNFSSKPQLLRRTSQGCARPGTTRVSQILAWRQKLATKGIKKHKLAISCDFWHKSGNLFFFGKFGHTVDPFSNLAISSAVMPHNGLKYNSRNLLK